MYLHCYKEFSHAYIHVQHLQQQHIEALEEMVMRLRIENAAIEAACATIE